MALKIADRVRETTTTTGTGTINLGGAVTNFETFAANLSNSDTTYYAIVDNTNGDFEVGLGTFSTGSPNTLARTTPIASSNSNSAVNFGSGTKDVFITLPASKNFFKDASGNINENLVFGDSTELRFGASTDLKILHTGSVNQIVGDGSNFVLESGATARASLGVAIGSDVQAFDAQLADVAGLTPSDGNIIIGDGSNFTTESGSTARASLGLTIGTHVQAYDAELAAIAGLTSAADKGIMFNGSESATTFDLTAAGRALLDDADAAAMRSTLGLVIGTDVAAADSTELSVTTSEPASIAIGDVEGMFVYDLSGSSSHTVQLPSTATAGCLGKSIIFKVKSTVNGQTLTISPASNQTIEGESSIVLNQERQSIRLVISEEYSSGSSVQCWVAV